MSDEYLSRLRATLQAWFAVEGGLEGKVITAPGAPTTGKSRLYPKSDGWYYHTNSGSETKLTIEGHVLDSSSHSVSGLVAGHVLQATGATTFGFATLPAHTLASSYHTASGLTAGWVLRATAATTFAWAALQAGDIPDLSSYYATTGHNHAATGVLPNTTNFNGILNPSTDTDVQLCLDKLDDHAHAALYAAIDHDATHITSGSDEIDGDKLDIDWNPANYTPALVTDYSTSVDNLTSHLKGIDTFLATIPSIPGSTTQVLFNDGGAWGADSGLTYAKATDALYIGGALGVGEAASAYAKIYAYWSQSTDPGASTYGIWARNYITAAAARVFIGLGSDAYATHTSGTVTEVRGYYGGASATGSGGTTTSVNAVYGLLNLGSGATVGAAALFYGNLSASAATTTTLYGLYLPNITGATGNCYGIYVAGSDDYGIYLTGMDDVAIYAASGILKWDDRHEFKEIATPSNPGSGYNSLYCKSDDMFYRKDSSGNELPLHSTLAVTTANGVTLKTLYANTLTAGASFRITVQGFVYAGGAPTPVTLYIRMGTATGGTPIICQVTAYSDATYLTYGFSAEAHVTVRTTGSSGTAIGGIVIHGLSEYSSGGQAYQSVVGYGTSQTINTTVDRVIEITYSAGTIYNCIIERL